MPLRPDAAALTAILPGTWTIGATNVPMWLDGTRLRPRFHFELRSRAPVSLHDVVGYTTPQGTEKTIVGVDRLRPDGFVWRGTRLHALTTSRWSVIGATGDSSILVIRFANSHRTPAGIDILVRDGRDGTDSHEFRAEVAGLAGRLGLTNGEFASLTWLELSH